MSEGGHLGFCEMGGRLDITPKRGDIQIYIITCWATQRMSPIRIFIGLLIGAIFLAGELVAFWHFNLSTKWIPVALFVFVGLAGGLIIDLQRRQRLQRYWQRACAGFRWRRRFPEAPKSEIRQFLDLFVDAFAFSRRRRCCFSPDDRIMEVYQTVYPSNDYGADCMELEFLCKMVKKRYGVDLVESWREDITLGEIYEQTHRVKGSVRES